VFRPVASYATVSRTMDGRRAGRVSAPLRADRAHAADGEPRAGLSSDQQIVNPGSQPPCTGADLRWRHPAAQRGSGTHL